MSILLQRARSSGFCPPSLLSEARTMNDDRFDDDVLSLLPAVGFSLRQDDDATRDFLSVLQKVRNVSKLPSGIDLDLRKKILEYRRAVLLAIVGGTSKSSHGLATIIAEGFLSEVKIWLDDALANGSVDFLLHLLSSVIFLPVTKTAIKDSGLGKAVGAIEKHRICKNTQNETAITQRIHQIKESWHARVKAQKIQESQFESSTSKRPAESDVSPISGKKIKTELPADDVKKVSSFSNLLKKVAASPPSVLNGTKVAAPSIKKDTNATGSVSTLLESDSNIVSTKKQLDKKPARRVKWADHFGGKICLTQEDEGDENESPQIPDATVSWSDRKKRDRLREKELLSKAKKSKLMDDGDDDGLDLIKTMRPTASWRIPQLLPDRTDVTKPLLESSEVKIQNDRIKTVTQAIYVTETDVPESPIPLSDAEQAFDMTSQGSAVIATIPFFVPQVTPSQAPTPVTIPSVYSTPAQTFPPPNTFPITPQYDTLATAEFVQSLGLPMFLVGQSRNAVQTLAGSPSLLSTLVDANGMYDQPRLMNLVRTLSASTAGVHASNVATTYQNPIHSYSAASTSSDPYSHPPSFHHTTKLIVDKSVEGNLHVSGYGPGTTESDLIASFSPYVRVDEIVMKGTFAFVNTSDPPGAARAREALSGTLIGGMPVKINQATRKTKDHSMAANHSNSITPFTTRGAQLTPYTNSITPTPITVLPTAMTPIPPMQRAIPPNIPDVDAVRDDRGNPATKNLFIAGYGPSTTEQQLRDVVSQYVQVVGVVLKGTFSFVNTTDRSSAVYAREMLGGTMLNGGVIRINFAKETGRLGTSFDLTYGPNTGPNALRNPPSQRATTTSMSYYGRSGGGGY